MKTMQLQQLALTSLTGAGPKLADKLQNLGLHSVADLLFHLPLRYQDRTRIVPIAQLREGDYALIEAEIAAADIVFRGKRMLLCKVSDGSGLLTLRFFHFTQAQRQRMQPGDKLRCFGEVKRIGVQLEIIHPEYQLLDEAKPLPLSDRLTAIYPITKGVSQAQLRKLITQALQLLPRAKDLQELLPADILKRYQFPDLVSALIDIHTPPPSVNQQSLYEGEHPAQQRLAFEELLAHHLSLRQLRNKFRHQQAQLLTVSKTLQQQFLNALPFKLTAAQNRVLVEIEQDLQQSVPMLRLVQGDVGSGKTVVAAIAALTAVANQAQVAVMAPTEILAEQHFQAFSEWLQPLTINTVLLTGQTKGRIRQQRLQAIAEGEAQVIIGTHALFQKDVEFQNLALAIVDEQHRFGVHQRLLLSQKGKQGLTPHQLIMTATPIPRTLAMCAYADLDQSVIDELPPGRKPITTVAIDNNRRQQVVDRIRQVCLTGQQVYWVCTLIEDSEVLQCQAAENAHQELQAQLPDLNIALVHGRMKPQEKEQVMQAFKQGDYQLLVATTVIEVGVNVPNASLMVIENPERLGLSQLHQLRGRVGRGSAESYCILLYQSPLTKTAKARLQVMRDTQNGFRIAEKDLELRGPGEVLGTRQTGDISLRVADLERDQHLLPQVQTLASELAQYPDLISAIIERWIGQAKQYAQV